MRPVQVHGQQMDDVEAVLLAVRLPLDQQHFLRDAVRRVGLFRVPVPQIAFEKRHGRELRVRTDRADADKLLHSAQARALHCQRAHHDVLVEEAARRLTVRADASDNGRQMDDDLRREVVEHATDVGFDGQIVVGSARGQDVAIPAAVERRGHMPAEEAVAAGDEHSPAA